VAEFGEPDYTTGPPVFYDYPIVPPYEPAPILPPGGVPADYQPAVPGPGFYTPAPAPGSPTGYPAPSPPPSVIGPAPPGSVEIPDYPESQFGGYPYAGGPFGYYGPGSSLSRRELDRLLGERSQTLFGLAGINIFRGTYRRPSLQTILRRGARVVARRLVERFFGGDVAPKGGLPVLAQSRPPFAWRIGGAIGAVIGLAVPSTLGRGEVFDTSTEGGRYLLEQARAARRLETAPGREYRRDQPGFFPQGGRIDVTPPAPPPAAPPDLNFRRWLRGQLQDEAENRALRGFYWPLGPNSARGPIMPIPAPELPAPAPVQEIDLGPVTGAGGRRSAAQRQRTQARIRLGLGSLAAGAVVGALRGGSSGSGSLPIVAPSPVQSPVSPIPAPLTSFNTVSLQSGFIGGGGADRCQCGPRGPRRKCLERAPVRWAGGRRKGKAAGSKCLRFAAARRS